MTIANHSAAATLEEASFDNVPLAGESGATLVARINGRLCRHMDERLLRPGSRLPSIRQFADQHRVSRFTVVEAYERLVALGYLESRRGSGFYVRERRAVSAPPRADTLLTLVVKSVVEWQGRRQMNAGREL
jgi:DNA-binding GntR family transcriptional regulator